MNLLTHETRTPLNGIILGSELLTEMEGLPEKAKQYVELVRESGIKIQELVEKISKYCSIKDGIDKNLTENAICRVIESIISKIDFGTAGGIVVRCDCDKNITFLADWVLLKEALSYVLDNAVINSREAGVVTVKCWKDLTCIIVQVEDQGPGIEVSMAERMFDGLFTNDLLHHGKGMGLNLAIAKEIFEEHGGRISCRNREECGTLFEILLKDQKM